jgi:4-O-beta-D-mannosyl-D-glucose phosphorylase
MIYQEKIKKLYSDQKAFIRRKNGPFEKDNGIFCRWKYPIITAEHTPIHWRYDLDHATNPHLMERLGVNATFNAGAIRWEGKYLVVVRVEGVDRKSFFAIAESPNGVDSFEFWDYPIQLPQNEEPDTNVYDMRLVAHEDGWIYGLFCTERKDLSRMEDTTAAIANCGIVRTKDLIHWDRLPDLISHSGQQRNVVLHENFIDGQYGFYTRPQDGFINVGSGGGIGWGLCKDIMHPEILNEIIIDHKVYHTIKEVKNGLGPGPLKTENGWMHLAHGVRNTAAGLRYVLYMFMTELERPWVISYAPGGHFLSPQGGERIGDVSNVAFSSGWIRNEKDEVFIYYASSDTRMHVATSTVEKLMDYVMNTPEDGYTSAASVKIRSQLITKNLEILKRLDL